MRVLACLLWPSAASSRARHPSVGGDERDNLPSTALCGILPCSSPFWERRRAYQHAFCCPLRLSLAPVTLLLFSQRRVILGDARRAIIHSSPQRPRETTREFPELHANQKSVSRHPQQSAVGRRCLPSRRNDLQPTCIQRPGQFAYKTVPNHHPTHLQCGSHLFWGGIKTENNRYYL